MSNRRIHPHDPIPAELLGRYLAGTASPDERAQIDAWRRANPLRDGVLDALAERPLVSHANTAHVNTAHASAADVEQRWQRIHGRISQHVTASDQLATEATRVRQEERLRAPIGRQSAASRSLWTYASALVVPAILVIAGIVAYLAPRHTTTAAGRQYATHAGQQARVTLADGSQVVLAPESKLTVPQDFNASTRTVSLDGEAYFQVRSGSATPFVVRTGTVSTRVLGTTFDVRRYGTDAVARVAVISGKVASSGRVGSVTLTAGTVGFITDSTATSVLAGHPSGYGDWQSGHLVFDNEPVADVLATLGRWYGYAFRLADSASASQRITAEFNVASREKTLQAIALLLDVTMQFDDTTVTLRPRVGHQQDTMSSHHGKQYPFSHVNEVGK